VLAGLMNMSGIIYNDPGVLLVCSCFHSRVLCFCAKPASIRNTVAATSPSTRNNLHPETFSTGRCKPCGTRCAIDPGPLARYQDYLGHRETGTPFAPWA
jgi:hypothetical protein